MIKGFWEKLKTTEKLKPVQAKQLLSTLLKCSRADYIQLVYPGSNQTSSADYFQYKTNAAVIHGLAQTLGAYIENQRPCSDEVLAVGDIHDLSFRKASDGFSHWINLPIRTSQDVVLVICFAFKDAPLNTAGNSQLLIQQIWRSLEMMNENENQDGLSNEDSMEEFAQQLTGINNRKEFQQLINQRLSKFIPFTACSFFVLDNQQARLENFFFDPRINLSAYPFNQSVPITDLRVDDLLDPINYAIANPGFFQTGYPDSSNDLRAFINPESEFPLEDGSCLMLFSGNRLLGYCLMFFHSASDKNAHEAKVKKMLSHFSAAILRIQMIESVEGVTKELSILEAVNMELAMIKEKEDLMRALYPHLSKMFSFSHHFVWTVNNDKFSISLLFKDSGSKAKFHPKFKEITRSSFLINDQILNKVLLSNEPLLFELDELAARQALPDYMLINYECGIKKMVLAGLQIDGLRIGIWAICLLEGQDLNKSQMTSIKVVSHQISIAARDVQNREVLKANKLDRDYLSQFSARIAMITKRSELINLISGVLKRKFAFSYLSILTPETNGNYTVFLDSANLNSLVEIGVDHTSEIFFPADPLIEKVVTARDLVIYDLEALKGQQGFPEFVHREYLQGVRTKVGMKLLLGDRSTGIIFYNLTEGAFSDKELDQLSHISLQISTAVSHILAIEDIAERQLERDLLFSLSTQIPEVNSHDQLGHLITSKLKKYIGFSHIAIGKLDDDAEHFSFFHFDPASKSLGHEQYHSLQHDKFSIQDNYTWEIMSAEEPVFFCFNALPEDALKEPLYVKINRESGIGGMMGVKLTRNGSDFGFLLMFFEQELSAQRRKSGLIKATANHIATALYNLIANQQVKNLSDARSQLLQFGIRLRMVKDEKTLSDMLGSQLKTLFNAENFLVTALDDRKISHRPIFYDQKSDLADMPEFLSWQERFQDVAQGVFEQILQADRPVTFSPLDIKQTTNVPLFIKLLSEENNHGFLGAVMKLGEEPIGLILFQHHHPQQILKQPELLDSILSQIAIVIVNILSLRKVELQLKEIESYKTQLEEEKIYLAEELETTNNYNEIIGQSTALRNSFQLVSQVAASDSTVLILGETGTGKELIARAIHNNSPRRNKLMVKVNCAALPPNLIESELFGHERGSFTGATERRIGKFELANGGTLFLDEVGEMPLDLQVKLLRALQEKEVERVGGKGIIRVDVRIIAATNRNLENEMEQGRFRSDLFYRLNIFPIFLPPLRERKEDIEPLVYHFLKHFNKKCGKSIEAISTKALQDLQRYNWPGNVRELEHLIERSVLLTNTTSIKEVLLPLPKDQIAETPDIEQDILRTIDQNEKEHIYRVLKYCAGRISGRGGAAEILGVPPTTLNSKIKRLGIKRAHIF